MPMHLVGWNGRLLSVYGSLGINSSNFQINRIEVEDRDVTHSFSLAEVSGIEKAIMREFYKEQRDEGK